MLDTRRNEKHISRCQKGGVCPAEMQSKSAENVDQFIERMAVRVHFACMPGGGSGDAGTIPFTEMRFKCVNHG